MKNLLFVFLFFFFSTSLSAQLFTPDKINQKKYCEGDIWPLPEKCCDGSLPENSPLCGIACDGSQTPTPEECCDGSIMRSFPICENKCDGSTLPLPDECCDGSTTPRPPLCDTEPPVDCSDPGAGDPGECTDICEDTPDPLPGYCCDGTVFPTPDNCPVEPPLDCSESGAGDPGECTLLCELTPDPLPGYCCDGTVFPTPDNCPLPPACDGSVTPLPDECCDGTTFPRPPLCDVEPPLDCSEQGAGDPGECTAVCEATPDPLPGYCCDGTVFPSPDNCPEVPVCDGSEWPLPTACCDNTLPQNAPLCDLKCDGSVKPLPIECCDDTLPEPAPICTLVCDGTVKPLPTECCDNTFPEVAPLCSLKCDGTDVPPEPQECCDGTFPPPFPPFCNIRPIGPDPLYEDCWHLENTGQTNYAILGGTPGMDLNVKPVIENGITGEGIKVGVSDTGIDLDHEDLNGNYSSPGSKNFYLTNPYDGDPVRGNDSRSQAHGTQVTGIIAAVGGNNLGARGVAPGAKFGGFNYLGTGVLQDIFKTLYQMDGPFDVFNYSYANRTCTYSRLLNKEIILNAYEDGVNNLRNGKGALYVKSAGNDYLEINSCANILNWFPTYLGNANFDENNNYIYTMVAGAMRAKGERSTYSLTGANLWITAPGGEFGSSYPAIMATDVSGCDAGKATSNSSGFDNGSQGNNANCDYTSKMNGTSSAAPNTSGVIALILDANPNLTWRDVRHILATTSTTIDFPSGPYSHPMGRDLTGHIYQQGWVENAAGYQFHNYYGFGLPNSQAAVAAALTYNTDLGDLVETGRWNISSGAINQLIPNNLALGTSHTIEVDNNLTVEAVQIEVTVSHDYVDNLGIELTSPAGTKSIIININSANVDSDLKFATFLSNAFYGENSKGNWTLKVIDGSDENPDGTTGTSGTLDNWKINVLGHVPNTPLKSIQRPPANVVLSKNRSVKKYPRQKTYQSKKVTNTDRHPTPADPFFTVTLVDYLWSPKLFAIFEKDYNGPVNEILGDLEGLKIIMTDNRPPKSYEIVKSRFSKKVGIYSGYLVAYGEASKMEPVLNKYGLNWTKIAGAYIISIDDFLKAYRWRNNIRKLVPFSRTHLDIIYEQDEEV